MRRDERGTERWVQPMHPVSLAAILRVLNHSTVTGFYKKLEHLYIKAHSDTLIRGATVGKDLLKVGACTVR